MSPSDAISRNEAVAAAQVVTALQACRNARCTDCGGAVCRHEVLFSIALGFKTAPRCLPCLACGLGRQADAVRDDTLEYIKRRECFRAGWEWANRDEGYARSPLPACLWPASSGDHVDVAAERCRTDHTPPVNSDAIWDAGELGCGDLVLELRQRLMAMPPRHVMELTAQDPGAPADLPAWCRLTGHRLVAARPPHYWIERRGT